MREVMEKMYMREITICYGLTETSPVFTQTSADDDVEHKCETVGRKHPPVDVRVIDPADGHVCGVGEPGELCCKGYNVMKGYYKMPEATAEAIDADGYLHSGDLGTVDADGYYRVTGRIKDMIIRGGENIYPLEVENFLLTMPGVLDAQVVGAPDERLGEIVVAFVRVRPGHEGMTEEGRARLGLYVYLLLQGAQARVLRGRLPHDAVHEGAEVQAARNGRRTGGRTEVARGGRALASHRAAGVPATPTPPPRRFPVSPAPRRRHARKPGCTATFSTVFDTARVRGRLARSPNWPFAERGRLPARQRPRHMQEPAKKRQARRLSPSMLPLRRFRRPPARHPCRPQRPPSPSPAPPFPSEQSIP